MRPGSSQGVNVDVAIALPWSTSSSNQDPLPFLVEHLSLPLETVSAVMRMDIGTRSGPIFLGFRMKDVRCC